MRDPFDRPEPPFGCAALAAGSLLACLVPIAFLIWAVAAS